MFCPQGHRGVCDRLSMRVPAYFIDDITRAQSRSWALKFQGGKYVLWEKANAENCGLVLDRAEIISPSHTPRRLTVNENIHLAGACLGVWKRRNKMRKERAVLPHPLATYLLPLRGDSKSRRANPAESGQPGLENPALKTGATRIATLQKIQVIYFLFSPPVGPLRNLPTGKNLNQITSARELFKKKKSLLQAEMW